jgi:hypothetical protein
MQQEDREMATMFESMRLPEEIMLNASWTSDEDEMKIWHVVSVFQGAANIDGTIRISHTALDICTHRKHPVSILYQFRVLFDYFWSAPVELRASDVTSATALD